VKLRTKIDQNRLVAEHVYVDMDNVEWFQSPDICHDALYAHALVQAIDEYGSIIGYQPIDWIKCRADEIMRGFGYTEEDHGSG
jgi:hypothetical protein